MTNNHQLLKVHSPVHLQPHHPKVAGLPLIFDPGRVMSSQTEWPRLASAPWLCCLHWPAASSFACLCCCFASFYSPCLPTPYFYFMSSLSSPTFSYFPPPSSHSLASLSCRPGDGTRSTKVSCLWRFSFIEVISWDIKTDSETGFCLRSWSSDLG